MASLKYLRINLFLKFIGPFQEYRRKLRMDHFIKTMDIQPGLKVLDLGGTAVIWSSIDVPLNITLLNLPGHTMPLPEESIHEFSSVAGDACDANMFDPGQFDLVFSNSVIEHVGDKVKRKAFADEVARLGKSYWIQTPAKSFPIEAHTGMPFWWYYPEWLRQRIIRGWRRKLPSWTEMVEETDFLTKSELETIFPNSQLYVEKAFFFTKSRTCYTVLTDD